MTKVKPFIKWAGGKTKLLPEIRKRYPVGLYQNDREWRYVELFLGGGAVLLDMLQTFPKLHYFWTVFANDANFDLILTWEVVRDHVFRLIDALKALQAAYYAASMSDKESMYYTTRSSFNAEGNNRDLLKHGGSFVDLRVNRAAQFIFLNKTTFNGLWRVNRKGEFNVSFGKQEHPPICDAENLVAVSILIQHVEFRSRDFADLHCLDQGNPIFIYADPPYKPVKATSFTQYTLNKYRDGFQERLAAFLLGVLDADSYSATHKKILLSNSGFADYFADLYSGFYVDLVKTTHTISRGDNLSVDEVLVYNYDLD